MVKQEIKKETNQEEVQPVKLQTDNKDLLSQFYSLASLDETVRVKTVLNIIRNLKTSEKQTDLDYTIQRLVKGLSSSRKAARQGYATALTHLITEFENVNTDKIFELLAENLVVTKSAKGHEERDSYFGQVFGYIAISKARKETKLNDSLLKKVVENLLRLSRKKSYLQEICCKAIADILSLVDIEMFKELYLPLLEDTLKQGWEKCTPEALFLTLEVQRKFKDALADDFFEEFWNDEDIFAINNLKNLSNVLLETTNSAHPRVHILWDSVLKQVLKRKKKYFAEFWTAIVEDNLMQSTHERKFLAINLLLFLSAIAPSNMMEIIYSKGLVRCIINSCQSKDNYLFNAVKDILKKLPSKVLSNPDKESSFEVIKSLVSRNGNVLFDSITHTKTIDEILQKSDINLHHYFDWLKDVFKEGSPDASKSDTKEVNNCRTWVAQQLYLLIRCCKTRNEEKLLIDVLKFIFLHSFFHVVKKSSKIQHVVLVTEGKSLDTLGSYTGDVKLIKLQQNSKIDQSLEEADIVPNAVFQQRFLSSLTDLTHFHLPQEDKGHKTRTFGGLTSDGEFIALEVLQYGETLLKHPGNVILVETWMPEHFEAFEKSMDFITSMSGDDGIESVSKTKGTQLIFIHTTLQLFSSKPEAIEILEDLHTCYEKAEEKKRRKKTEPHWTEVLTEILLGFLVQPSHLLRQVVDMVFPSIAPHLSSDAFKALLEALKPKKKPAVESVDKEIISSGSDDSDDDEDDEEEEENDDDDDDDEERGKDIKKSKDGDKNGEGDHDSDDNDGDETSDDDDDDDDDSDMEVDEEFKTDLKKALGNSAVNSDDEEDLSDEDMDAIDQSEFDRLDQALASVFSARKERDEAKKNEKGVKISMLHFKLRVLDLIEIFIKKHPKDPKILTLLEPLLEVLKVSHGHVKELALFDRTLGIYKNKLCQLHEYPAGVDLNVEETHAQIERLVALAKKASSALFVNYITHGIVYLIRVLRGNPEIKGPSPLKTRSQRKRKGGEEKEKPSVDPDHVGCIDEKRIVGCLKEALTEFMTKRSSHLQPSFFNETIQRFPELAWQFVDILPQYLTGGCNNFRKVKACEMLKLLFSKKTKKFPEILNENLSVLEESLCKAFAATKSEGYSLKARQFQDIVHLADIVMKEVNKNEESKKSLDRIKLVDALKDTLDSAVVTRSSTLNAYCLKIIKAIETPESDDNSKSKKKKKKKAN